MPKQQAQTGRNEQDKQDEGHEDQGEEQSSVIESVAKGAAAGAALGAAAGAAQHLISSRGEKGNQESSESPDSKEDADAAK